MASISNLNPKIRISPNPPVLDLPILVALEHDLFKKAGLDVDYSVKYADHDKLERDVLKRQKEALFEGGAAEAFNVCEWGGIDRLERGSGRGVLALFRDEEVGCVQTPQHFFNPDPLQHGFGAASRWPDEQRFFFDVLLASKDAWGVAFCCGTSSVTRREALQQVGGFPTESVTEDMLLSLKLKESRWKTAYLNERLSMGLAPEGVSEYITQRGRWCLGFMQIARSKWGVLGSATLPAIDRISLFDAFLYWGTSFPFRILCLIAPLMYGFTGLAVIHADAQGALEHYAPSLCTTMIVLAWITRGRVLPIVTDAAQLLVTMDAIKAAAVGLFKPKGHKFKVTAKGGERDRLKVQWGLIARFLLPLLLATLGAVAYGTFYVFSPVYGNQNAPIWLFWSYYNAIVIAVTIFTCIELPRPKTEGFRVD